MAGKKNFDSSSQKQLLKNPLPKEEINKNKTTKYVGENNNCLKKEQKMKSKSCKTKKLLTEWVQNYSKTQKMLNDWVEEGSKKPASKTQDMLNCWVEEDSKEPASKTQKMLNTWVEKEEAKDSILSQEIKDILYKILGDAIWWIGIQGLPSDDNLVSILLRTEMSQDDISVLHQNNFKQWVENIISDKLEQLYLLRQMLQETDNLTLSEFQKMLNTDSIIKSVEDTSNGNELLKLYYKQLYKFSHIKN